MNAPELLVGAAAYSILTMLGLVAVYSTINHRDTFPFQQCLFVTAMTIRFASAIALHEPNLYRMVVGSADASGWDGGLAIKQAIDQSELGPLAIPQQFYLAFERHNGGYGPILGLYFYLTRLE